MQSVGRRPLSDSVDVQGDESPLFGIKAGLKQSELFYFSRLFWLKILSDFRT